MTHAVELGGLRLSVIDQGDGTYALAAQNLNTGASPSNSVVAETAAGASSSAGNAATYSRGNHTHGTPAADGDTTISQGGGSVVVDETGAITLTSPSGVTIELRANGTVFVGGIVTNPLELKPNGDIILTVGDARNFRVEQFSGGIALALRTDGETSLAALSADGLAIAADVEGASVNITADQTIAIYSNTGSAQLQVKADDTIVLSGTTTLVLPSTDPLVAGAPYWNGSSIAKSAGPPP